MYSLGEWGIDGLELKHKPKAGDAFINVVLYIFHLSAVATEVTHTDIRRKWTVLNFFVFYTNMLTIWPGGLSR